MQRRTRRWRLPLAVFMAAAGVLAAVGALGFGFFSQSTAAPASHPAWGTEIKLSSPSSRPVSWPRNGDMNAQLTVKTLQQCDPGHCDDLHGTVRVFIRMDGDPLGDPISAELHGSGGGKSASVTVAIPGSRFTKPGLGFINFDFGSTEFGPSSDGERLSVRQKYAGTFRFEQSSDSSDVGEKVDFTATYSGGDSVPDTPGGTLTLRASGTEASDVETVPVTGRTVSFSTTKLPAGTRFVSLKYGGDDKFDSGESNSLNHTVRDAVATTTKVTSVTPNPAVAGREVTVKTKVTANTGGAIPTGTMTIRFGGTGATDVAIKPDGTAELKYRVFKAADVEATFVPQGAFQASTSAKVALAVGKADATMTVAAQPEAAGPGKPITLTFSVDPIDSTVTPSGTATFSDGDTTLGTCDLQGQKQCAITTDKLALSKHTIKAGYARDDSINDGSATGTVRVFEGSTTKLTAAPSGTVVALTAQVAGADPKLAVPLSGKVTFLDGTKELGKADVDKDGKAALSLSPLAAGTHSLTARFEGSDALAPSASEAVALPIAGPGTSGQGGGSLAGGSQGGGAQGGHTQQAKNLASTGASIAAPAGIGALLLIMGLVALTLTRRRSSR